MKNRLILVIVLITVGGLYLLLRSNFMQDQAPKSSSLNKIPSKNCSGIPTPKLSEGPYYKIGSPQTNNIVQGIIGEKLTVIGFVFDKNCQPIANARLDFWQADAKGVYDNIGYKLRGHLYTDRLGKYVLETIVPGAYETRPPHIHVKVGSGNGRILTSQLYFPDTSQNQSDSIVNKDLIIHIVDGENGKVGTFNFVLQ